MAFPGKDRDSMDPRDQGIDLGEWLGLTPKGNIDGISDRLEDKGINALLDGISDRFGDQVANILSNININPDFRIGAIRRDLFDHIRLSEGDDRVHHWVWALSGGGAKGAFQFGAMLYLSNDVLPFPKGIASTSVGSLNLVGAAERSMRGIEKLKRSWLEVQNLHDMFTISPWIQDIDGLGTLRRKQISLQNLLERSTPRSLQPAPGSLGESIESQLSKIADMVPSTLETIGFFVANVFTVGILGLTFLPFLEFSLEEVREALDDLGVANSILSERADGIWRFDPMRERILRNLDLPAIRRAGTHLRIVMVSLNDTLAYSVDEQLRIYNYTTDRITEQFGRGPSANVIQALNYDGHLLSSEERILFTQAVLASASIPIISPPITLRQRNIGEFEDWLSTQYMVDGGVRETLPIDQAIDIIQTDLESLPGRKGIIAIGAGVANPSREDYLFAELVPPPFELEQYKFKSIGETSLSIAIEEILSNELRIVRDRLPVDIEGLEISPSFLLGETTDIDPGIVQISIAYGWMTAFDKIKQAELGLSPEDYRAGLWLHTNFIAQARYLVWKLEREGTSFYHEHAGLWSGLISAKVPQTDPHAGAVERMWFARGALSRAIWRRVPTGWSFKSESKVGTRMVNILQRIRELKRHIKLLITQRVELWGLESLPTVHDLSSFGVGNENCFADWYRHWERHAVQPNTGYPTGPGLINSDGRGVIPFSRHNSPWDAQSVYHIGDIYTFPLGAALAEARAEYDEEYSGAISSPFDFSREIPLIFDIDPRRVGFEEVAADERELAWFERDPDYAIVRLEGYVFGPEGGAREGTVSLRSFYHAGRNDHWTTTAVERLVPAGYEELYRSWQGYIFSPGGSQPRGTIPLYTWFSDGRNDHLTTSDWRFIEGNPLYDGSWNPVDIEPDESTHAPLYTPARLEGYIFPPDKPKPAGTVPLYRWISFTRRDNFTTSDPEWVRVPTRPPLSVLLPEGLLPELAPFGFERGAWG